MADEKEVEVVVEGADDARSPQAERGPDGAGGSAPDAAERHAEVPSRRSRLENRLYKLNRRLGQSERLNGVLMERLSRFEQQSQVSAATSALDAAESRLAAREQATQERLRKARADGDEHSEISAIQDLGAIGAEKQQLRGWRDQIRPSQDDGARDARQPRQLSPLQEKWRDENDDWFAPPPGDGEREYRTSEQIEMTNAVLQVDQEVAREGFTPDRPDYFREVNRRMAARFPDYFTERGDAAAQPAAQPARNGSAPVLAPSRTAAPKPGGRTVKLTAAQLESARKMHLTPEQFAKYVS